MKKLLLLFCLLIPLLAHASSYPAVESLNSRSRVKPYKQTIYWKHHRVEKAFAISTLSLGGTAVLGGGFFCIVSGMADDNRSMNAFGWITIGGAVCAAGSIPLFVLAHKSAKKAKASVEVSPSLVTCQPISGKTTNNLALSVSVNF
jgi:hypothetical protein